MKNGVALSAILLFLPSFSYAKWLKAFPEGGQTIREEQSSPDSPRIYWLIEKRNDLQVSAAILRDSENFTVRLAIQNSRDHSIEIEQERFFLLNAYDREIYRISDLELRRAWAGIAKMPPPPPSQLKQYSVRSDGLGGYTIEEQQSFDASMENLGSAIGTWLRHRKARQKIELIDKEYFRNSRLEPGKWSAGRIDFAAILTSPRTPVKLVLDIEGSLFTFTFCENAARSAVAVQRAKATAMKHASDDAIAAEKVKERQIGLKSLKLWKSPETETVFSLNFDDDRILLEALLPEVAKQAGESISGELIKKGDGYRGFVKDTSTCDPSGRKESAAVERKTCSFQYAIEFTSVSPSQITGLLEGPPPEAEFDCAKCSWSRSPIFHYLKLVPQSK